MTGKKAGFLIKPQVFPSLLILHELHSLATQFKIKPTKMYLQYTLIFCKSLCMKLILARKKNQIK